mmetsp:Transcript_27421/g.53489  ORF Transcript_27421/g.53489 Transcript_27421/m.53489 type:complete len:88 (+) Transcript_27421:41-304(+)
MKILFKKIINEFVTIELKNGIILNGSIVKIDSFMNIYLKNAKRSLLGKNSVLIPAISIRGAKIRYIILPNWVNLDSVFNKSPEKNCF